MNPDFRVSPYTLLLIRTYIQIHTLHTQTYAYTQIGTISFSIVNKIYFLTKI